MREGGGELVVQGRRVQSGVGHRGDVDARGGLAHLVLAAPRGMATSTDRTTNGCTVTVPVVEQLVRAALYSGPQVAVPRCRGLRDRTESVIS